MLIAVITQRALLFAGFTRRGDSGQFVLRLHLVWRAVDRLCNFCQLRVWKRLRSTVWLRVFVPGDPQTLVRVGGAGRLGA